jgi:hypothetical protein
MRFTGGKVKKIAMRFGLISGAISSLSITGLVLSDICFTPSGEVVGYSAMVLSFLLVFFGIRSYRDNVAGGSITFGRAFSVGMLITLISCVCYVVTWEILYFNFIPDFAEKFLTYYVERLSASGASQEAIQAELGQMKEFMEMYRNPAINVAFTFIEPLPVGLIMTLISAATLRKKNPTNLPDASTAEI